MRLRIYPTATLSADEKKLVEKVRRAASDHLFTMTDSRGGPNSVMSVEVFIFDAPLRLDFKILSEEESAIGGLGAFIGPQIALTEDLFEGEDLKPSMWAQVSASFDAFAEHWQRQTA